MDGRGRIFLIALMWMVGGAVMIASAFMVYYTFWALLIGLGAGYALVEGTQTVWKGANNAPAAVKSSGKAKRTGTGKASLLLELMDADERAAFKQALQQQILDQARYSTDGELTDLESLLSRNGRR